MSDAQAAARAGRCGQLGLTLVMLAALAAARAAPTPHEHAAPQADAARALGPGRDLDCTIDVDRNALRAGWVEVRFALRPGSGRAGCETLALDAITLELWYQGKLLRSAVAGPVSRIAPPHFSHGLALSPEERLRRGRFEIRARGAGWRPNAVGFALPRP